MTILPEYLLIFDYLILVWQLLSMYFDSYATVFKSYFAGKGPIIMSTFTFIFALSQTLIVFLYLNSVISANFLSG